MVVSRYEERQLPYDLGAEQAVLGSLLIDSEAVFLVMHVLRPEDFHRARNNYCYAACLEVAANGDAIDQITVARALARRDVLEEVGGLPYLGELIAETPTSVNVEHYAAIVADTASRRRLITAGMKVTELGFEEARPFADLYQEAGQVVASVPPSGYGDGAVHISEVFGSLLQRHFGEGGTGDERLVPTGFAALDGMLHVQRSNLVILGARPGVGKTSLVLDYIYNAACRGMTCLLFTLELSREEVGMRMLSSECGVSIRRLQDGLYTEEEEKDAVQALGFLSGLPVYVNDSSSPTMAALRAGAQQVRVAHGLDLVVVDYLQLVQGAQRGNRYENRVQEISQISRDLKAMARDLDVPVLACSQLSRASEMRSDHRPRLSDLRESGSIEQDADVVLFLYREDKDVSEDDWARQNPGREYPRGLVEVNIAKHRNGPTGVVYLCFRESVMRFYDIGDDSTVQTAA